MSECYCCKEEKHSQIPLLVCGCYCCSECYCKLKSSGYNNCLLCKKTLRRSSKGNNLIQQIYKLDMLYSA